MAVALCPCENRRWRSKDRRLDGTRRHRRNLGGAGNGANAPLIFFYQRIVFFLLLSWRAANKNNWVESGRKRCLYIKDWFNPIFPLFLTWLLRWGLNTHGQFPPPSPNVISQVTPMSVDNLDTNSSAWNLTPIPRIVHSAFQFLYWLKHLSHL
jgi:hypothetical protein